MIPPGILQGRVLVVGVGRELRADDAAGLALVRELRGGRNSRLICLECGAVPENYVAEIARRNPDTVILADAAELGAEPGSFRFLTAGEVESLDLSTHGVPLPLVMAEIEARTGARVWLLGIQPASLGLGQELSPPVHRTVVLLAQVLARAATG
jgi:hydrogenase 3 maturation protease